MNELDGDCTVAIQARGESARCERTAGDAADDDAVTDDAATGDDLARLGRGEDRDLKCVFLHDWRKRVFSTSIEKVM